MSGFELKNIAINNLKVENNIEEITVRLIVSFFDYIEKENGVVARGNKDRKVEMTYLLTFVSSQTSSDKCSHCCAKIENGETVCSYCHSNIQSIGKEMKLAKKEVLNQK